VTATTGFPHGYPFRFADVVLEERNSDFSRGRVRVSVTANGRAAMGERWGSPLLLIEAIAQAALLLEGGDAETGRRGFLAGIEGFEASRPPIAGEMLSIDVRLSARFGSMARFDGDVTSAGESIAHGGVFVRRGDAAPGSAA